jgi:hypothetical protein
VFYQSPLVEELAFPLDYKNIQLGQKIDEELLLQRQAHPGKYPIMQVGQGIELIGYRQNTTTEPKIAIPTLLLNGLVRWYHLLLNHVRINNLHDTIHMNFHHPRLREVCARTVQMCDCIMNKNPGPSYGELPESNVNMTNPFQTVAVDLIGPWKVTVNQHDLIFNALTIIDPDTNLMEACPIRDRSSATVARDFENTW